MKKTITLYDFRDAFKALRPENFSYDGLEVLYDYLTDLEEGTGEEIELDVIELCCTFSEIPLSELIGEEEGLIGEYVGKTADSIIIMEG